MPSDPHLLDGQCVSEREWLEGLRYEDKFACACEETCGDVPEEHDPFGVCKGLPRAHEPLLECRHTRIAE